MGLIIPEELISSLKYKHLLLDTNIFIDSLLHPADFTDFFNVLKIGDVTLVTIDLVKIEFLKGAQDDDAYSEKEEIFNSITESILPTDDNVVIKAYELIKKYKLHGKSIAMADLFLGANLMRYATTACLLTRNTNDFPSNIFSLEYIINYPLSKGIFTYGVYKIK